MKVTVFTEGGRSAGLGHMMRCVSLCQALEERGVDPRIIINGRTALKRFTEFKNIQFLDWIREKRKLSLLLEDADAVIIDSYLADLRLYRKVSEMAAIAAYFDDNKRLDYPKGIVINGNIYAEKLNYRDKEGVSYLLGTRYAPLRKEFWKVPQKKVNKRVKNVLVALGGTDKSRLIDKIISHLKGIFDFDFFVNKPSGSILSAKETFKMMTDADICISAGGQTSYELARLGVPVIGICIADNQMRNIVGLQEAGFLEYAGWYNDRDIFRKIEKVVNKLLPYEERLRRCQIGASCVDGNGARRIADRILNLN